MSPEAVEVFETSDQRGWRRALVVTALGLELAAVRAHTDHLVSVTTRDGSFLELGHFSADGTDWLIVFAESGAGTHAAQEAANRAFLEFGPFEIAFFVGVAGGRKDESVVGTVVASSKVYMAYSGKWKDGSFSSRPDLKQTNYRLVAAAKKVERDARWQDRIRPPIGMDLPDDADYPQPKPPAALIAPIISTEAVSADPNSELEEQITRHFNDACAVEMEGYGFMFSCEREQTKAIVVRGISDGRGDKQPGTDLIFQPVAAAHAAAFTFEILSLWGATYQNRPLSQELAELKSDRAQELPAPEKPSSAPEIPSTRETAVLSFRGAKGDFPPERQQEILAALREFTDDPSLEIIGSKEGSFHLFLRGESARLKKLYRPESAKALSDQFGVKIDSVLPEEEYQKLPDATVELRRASEPLLRWPQTLPDDTWIERPEFEALLQRFEDGEGSTTALIGEPGSGKTALLSRLGSTLQANGISFLAIKADLLDPEISTEEHLRDALGVKEIPSALMIKLSQVRPAVLIIDQLDALAGYVDLRTGRLSVLLNLVRKLGLRRNVHIVLSSRLFEYNHDTRLKTVQAESLTLELPAWSGVLEILEANGIKAGGWPSDAQAVMRTPQALATFLSFSDKQTIEPFTTYQAMLETLWQTRIVQQPNGSKATKLAGHIAEDMAERETLWVAASKYDEQSGELAQLLAAGILARPTTPGSIGFSHQTVFEFVLARSFAQKGGRLSLYALEREASLFVRPKLWASLSYLRAVEPATYQSELLSIWMHKGLRRNLRFLLLEFVGQQSAPLEGEGTLVDQALKTDDRRHALQAIVGSRGWFKRYRTADISQSMRKTSEAGFAAHVLMRVSASEPEQVTKLIQDHWSGNKDFDQYAWPVLDEMPTWDATHLELAKSILERTEISPFTFENTISTIGAEQPEMAAKLALAKLEIDWEKAIAESERRAALPDAENPDEHHLQYRKRSQRAPLTNVLNKADGWDGLEAIAKLDPVNFLEVFWEWFRGAFARISKIENVEPDIGFPLNYGVNFRFEGEENGFHLPEDALLGALRVAVETLALKHKGKFLEWLERYEKEDNTPAQRLFAHAFTVAPERYATRAFNFLLADKRRLRIGHLEDNEATTKRLIEAVVPHWNEHELSLFVKETRGYSPTPGNWRDASQRQNFLRQLDRIKFQLLDVLPKDRLGEETISFLESERRRFGDAPAGVKVSGVHKVDSPISAEQMENARVEHIVNAFQGLPDSTGWDNPKGWGRGGNIQLSRAFADLAKRNPEKAMRVIAQFDPEFGTRASGYAAEAMAEEADPAKLLELIHNLENRGFRGEEYRGNLGHAVSKLVQRKVDIDDNTLEILISWLSEAVVIDNIAEAEEDDDNSLASSLPTKDEEEKADREGSVLWGMGEASFLPHGNFPVLEALMQVYLRRQDYEPLLALLSEHLKRDENQKVWSALFWLLGYVKPENPKTLELFLVSLFDKYPGLAETREGAIFLARMHWAIPDFVKSALEHWRANPAHLVQQAFGEIAALVWLLQANLSWPESFIQEILENGTSRAKTGVAYAAVNVWAEVGESERAFSVLRKIISHADEPTWSAIMDIFRLVDEIAPTPEWIGLLRAIEERLKSHPASPEVFLVERLQSLLPHEAVLVGRIASVLVQSWKQELGDLRTATSASSTELIDIAVTLHRLSPETRETGLAIFEDLLDANAYSAVETLRQIDNRFYANITPRRPRLPRRNRAARR